MLRLPPVLHFGDALAQSEKEREAHVLRFCMHLNGETETQLDDFETIRKRKASKIREAARRRGEEDFRDTRLLPEVKGSTKVKKALGQSTKVVSGTGNIVKLPPEHCKTGGDEAPSSPARQNISHTGSWLDRRAFASINDVYYGAGQGRKDAILANKDGMNDADRQFLRRCKEVLRKRYGNIQIAWRKLNIDNSESVTVNEFVRSTSSLFPAYQARLLYGLLDADGDGSVTFRELITLLDAA